MKWKKKKSINLIIKNGKNGNSTIENNDLEF